MHTGTIPFHSNRLHSISVDTTPFQMTPFSFSGPYSILFQQVIFHSSRQEISLTSTITPDIQRMICTGLGPRPRRMTVIAYKCHECSQAHAATVGCTMCVCIVACVPTHPVEEALCFQQRQQKWRTNDKESQSLQERSSWRGTRN